MRSIVPVGSRCTLNVTGFVESEATSISYSFEVAVTIARLEASLREVCCSSRSARVTPA